jgi:hypothetical protein
VVFLVKTPGCTVIGGTKFENNILMITHDVVLGGLVFSVLATGPKVRGFNPGRGRWNFKGDKNP